MLLHRILRSAFVQELAILVAERQKALELIRSGDKSAQAEGCLRLSCHYYRTATAGTCKLTRASVWQLGWQAPLWAVTWFPLNLWSYYRMLPLSDRATNVFNYGQMTVDECLVRHSILLIRRQYEEAGFAATYGLRKEPMPAHIRGLFHLGLAEVHRHFARAQEAREDITAVLAEIRTIDGEDPREAIRIYQLAAKLIERVDMPRNTISPSQLRARARELAGQFA